MKYLTKRGVRWLIVMYENYHSNYIVYPVLSEEKIIRYLKDHKLKKVINDILSIVKQYKDILLHLFIEENKLIIQVMYSTTVTRNIQDHTTTQITEITQDYNNLITVTPFMIHEDNFNILRGFT